MVQWPSSVSDLFVGDVFSVRDAEEVSAYLYKTMVYMLTGEEKTIKGNVLVSG